MPFLGFGALPKYKAAIIDIHGTEDDVIPYSVDNIGSYGRGPEGETSSVVSYDGMFYLEKQPYIQFLGIDIKLLVTYKMLFSVEGFQCDAPEVYPTDMDGVDSWGCVR